MILKSKRRFRWIISPHQCVQWRRQLAVAVLLGGSREVKGGQNTPLPQGPGCPLLTQSTESSATPSLPQAPSAILSPSVAVSSSRQPSCDVAWRARPWDLGHPNHLEGDTKMFTQFYLFTYYHKISLRPSHMHTKSPNI